MGPLSCISSPSPHTPLRRDGFLGRGCVGSAALVEVGDVGLDHSKERSPVLEHQGGMQLAKPSQTSGFMLSCRGK